ncbi:MAG: hypothetical protein AAGC44_14290 [Planctomycetota bacterium]
MVAINITMTEELQALLTKRLHERGMSDPTEYIHQLIRDDCEHAVIEQLLIDGLNSGDAGPLDDQAWTDIREAARKRNQSRESA